MKDWRDFLEEPREEFWEKYDVTYCQYCGRVKRGDRWGYFNPIKLIVEKYVGQISRRLPPGYEVKTYKIFKTDKEREGYRLYELIISVIGGDDRKKLVRHFWIRENLGVCPRCSRKLSGYHEAIVQIRGPKEKVKKAYEEVRDKVETMDSFVRMEELREGINVYFLDHAPARRLAKFLVNRRGAKHILTRSLLKIEDGKRKGIETHSVRLPEFDSGDLVSIDNRMYIFKGVKRGRYELLRLPDLKSVSFPNRTRIELVSKPSKGIAFDADESVTTVFKDGEMVYAKAVGKIKAGEEVNVYEHDGTFIAISKRRIGEKMSDKR